MTGSFLMDTPPRDLAEDDIAEEPQRDMLPFVTPILAECHPIRVTVQVLEQFFVLVYSYGRRPLCAL